MSIHKKYVLKEEYAAALSDCGVDQTLDLEFTKNVVMPFYQLNFAKEIDGHIKSTLCADAGLKPEEWLATRILEALESKHIQPLKKGVTFVRNNATAPGILYSLVYYDPESSIFQPTILQPLQRASNLSSECDVEILLSFGEEDDEYILPVVKTFRTAGDYAPTMLDIFSDILNELDGNDPLDFFEDTNAKENITVNDDGSWSVFVSSPIQRPTTLDFGAERYEMEDFRRAITSIRLIRLKEDIQ